MKRILPLVTALLVATFGFSNSADTSNGTISYTVNGNDLTVAHQHYEGSCDLTFSSSATLEGMTLDVVENIDEVTTCCIRYYDFSTTIYDLAPGTYTVRVWDARGMVLLSEAMVEIDGDSRLTAETGDDLDYTYWNSGCLGY